MKKFINVIIALVIAIGLAVAAILVVKPNNTYTIVYGNEMYVSTDNVTFSYENKIITYSKQDVNVTIDTADGRMVYNTETGEMVFAVNAEIFAAGWKDGVITLDGLTESQVQMALKYINILPESVNSYSNDNISVKGQKILCVLFSILIGIFLSLLLYPKYIFDRFQTPKSLIICVGIILIFLCATSGFYLFYILK